MRIIDRLLGRSGMLSCRQVGKVLQTYLDEELDPRAAQKVAEHLDDCRRCGLEAEVYDALRSSLRHGPGPLPQAPVARLREFGERLARGEMDQGDLTSW